MSRRTDEQLVALICAELDRHFAEPDPDLQARLDHTRQQALEQASATSSAAEQAWAVAARSALNQDGTLPPEVTTRLDEIRGAALSRLPAAQKSAPEPGLWQAMLATLRQRWQLPAGMVATGIVLVTAVSLIEPLPPVDTLSAEQELALLAAADDIELYENLDFYLWLADRGFATQ